MSDNATIIRNFCAEWDAPAPDGDKLASYFTEDAFYHNIPMQPVTGRDSIRAALSGSTTPWSDACAPSSSGAVTRCPSRT